MARTHFSDLDSRLAPDLVRRVAIQLAEDRNAAIASSEPTQGETATSVGLRAYERSKFSMAHRQMEWAWLRVKVVDQQVHLYINGTPVRFCSSREAEIPWRHRHPTQLELAEPQGQLLDGSRLYWRFITQDERGDGVVRVYLQVFGDTHETESGFGPWEVYCCERARPRDGVALTRAIQEPFVESAHVLAPALPDNISISTSEESAE